MLTLQEMKSIKPFNNYLKNAQNVFLFPSADGLASHVIKSLLYRLENVEQTSYIIIQDKKEVDKKDVESGIYINEDIKKKRGQVLTDRYGGAFGTEVIYGIEDYEGVVYMNTNRSKNLFIINTNLAKAYTRMDINAIVKASNRGGAQGGIRSNAYVIDAFSNGEDVIVRTMVGSGGNIYGEFDKTEARNAGFSMAEQYLRNAMLGQMIFNLVNSIVTDGMSFNYSKIQGNIKKGKFKKEYLKGRRDDSIFTRLGITNLDIEGDSSYKFDDEFCIFEEIVKERIQEKTRRLIGVSDKMVWYASLVLADLGGKGEGESQEYKEYITYMTKLLTKIMMNSTNLGTNLEMAIQMNTLLAFIESKTGTVWGG